MIRIFPKMETNLNEIRKIKKKNKEFICEILFFLCGARSSQGLFLEFRRFRAEENQICFWSGFHETYSRGEGLKLQYQEAIIGWNCQQTKKGEAVYAV